MKNNYFYCIGVMSGTSLDGIDIAYVKMNKNSYKDFTILKAETISYSREWKNSLQEAILYNKEELLKLDIIYGKLLGKTLKEFIDSNKIEELDFIASHGHTILHQPEKGITLQIGSGKKIANITKKKVVCDFRTQDVNLGGQGAPLVPIGDKLLFSEFEYCLNLGGFANVSFEKEGERIAFDICPVNIVLNHYTRILGFEYDDGGKIAREGNVNQLLLEELNQLEFYMKTPPKSLGMEWVKQEILPMIDRVEKDIPSILRTFVEHVAIQIGLILKGGESVLVTGGGVYNSFLIERIEFFIGKRVVISSERLINYKEALIFAFLGVLKLKEEVNCLQSVTGASKDHSSGVVFYP